MIKTIVLYQLSRYKTLELVVISEPIFSSDNYDPRTSGRIASRNMGIISRRGLNRLGRMTSNGSESLNNVFRIARQLPLYAIVENTWHKCVEWFY
jgi:hypothetical protein